MIIVFNNVCMYCGINNSLANGVATARELYILRGISNYVFSFLQL